MLRTMLNHLKGIHVESGQKAVHLSRTSAAQNKAGLQLEAELRESHESWVMNACESIVDLTA